MTCRYVTIGLLVCALAGCRQQEKAESSLREPVSIRLHRVNYEEFSVPVRTTGMLGTTAQIKLSFKTGGIIQRLDLREGQPVRKGQVLAALDLAEIKAQVEQARIGLEKAERDLTRAENLYRDSVATLEQFQDARSAYELASTRKEIAEFNLQHSVIRAPSDGKIQKILVEVNEMIAPGHPAIVFASTESDWVVRAALTDKDVVKLAIGDSAAVSMDAFPDIRFAAEVVELGSVADPVTGTYEVELMLDQPPPELRTGFICRAEIHPGFTSRSLVVPVEALLDAADNVAALFTYSDGRVTRQKVTTGRILGDKVAIGKGLNEGDLVVTDGARYLTEESEVHPVNTLDLPQP